jgi:integrase
MTADQAAALLRAAREDGYLGPYVILSLTTGIRTEEARALRWDHVELDGDPGTGDPPHIAVWRSIRAGNDTKTERSRRTLALPGSDITAVYFLDGVGLLGCQVVDGESSAGCLRCLDARYGPGRVVARCRAIRGTSRCFSRRAERQYVDGNGPATEAVPCPVRDARCLAGRV